ncbi:MAG: PEP-CTERM system histidine kinase PrsK [Candidatus Scalindua sp.]|nr:PEP-CTERM system histidine kinase PrsK [Candidatus Scalindua sp.]
MLIRLISTIPIINACLCLGLGVFTLSRNPKRTSNIGFFLGMLSLAILNAGDATLLLGGNSYRMAFNGMRLSIVGQSLLPPSLLLFSVVFARKEHRAALIRWLPLLVITAAASFVFIYFLITNVFVTISLFNLAGDKGSSLYLDDTRLIFGPIGYYFYIYFIIGTLLCLTNLESTFRSSKGINRFQIKYVIFCLGGILFFFIYLASQILLFSNISIQLIPAKSLVTLICTVIMTFSIVKQRLLDVDIFVSRYVVYNSVAIIGTCTYLLVLGVAVEAIKFYHLPFHYFIKILLIFVSLFILVILLFVSGLRRKIQLFINRHFYKHKYEFRDTWMETIVRISSRNSIDDICNTLLEMISQLMGAQNVTVWLYNSAKQKYTVFLMNDKNEKNSIGEGHALIGIMREKGAPFIVNEHYGRLSGKPDGVKEIEAVMNSTKAVLCSPMEAAGELVGFILQGEDIGGESYRVDDFELLKALSTQAAVQIKNIRLAQELSTAKEVEMFHWLSSFVMHDLKNLTNSLSLITQNARHNLGNIEFQKDSVKTIESTVNRMQGLIDRLSSLPRGIELKRESVDLKTIVEHVLQQVKRDKRKNISLETEIDKTPIASIDPHAIEMVMMNLINNACDAIESEGKVECGIWEENNVIKVSVTDNGKGISDAFIDTFLFKPFKSSKKGGFGVGLFQCKAIVEAHNGRIEVKSKEGVGTTFTISLPHG